MNNEDLLEAIGSADEKLLEQSEKRKNVKRNWIVSTVAAVAVFVLLFNIVWPNIAGMYAASNHQIVPGDPIWVETPSFEIPELSNNGSGIGGMLPATVNPWYQFCRAKSVHVKIKEILPDVYCKTNGLEAYWVLHLQVLDTIVGENIPKEIYYLLPGYLSPALEEYDSFIMTVEQVGLENYMLVNATQKRAETFTLLFQSPKVDAFSYISEVPTYLGAVLAFKNGTLDTGLWDKDGWNLGKEDLNAWTQNGMYDAYPGKVGRSIADTKKAIQKVCEPFKREGFESRSSVIKSEYFDWPQAEEAFSYIRSWGIGAFAQYYFGDHFERQAYVRYADKVVYERIINGFRTNETIIIEKRYEESLKSDDDLDEIYQNVEYSDARFTKEDVQKLPDLMKYRQIAENLAPPEVEPGNESLTLYRIQGEYHKSGEHVFGVLSLYWGYADEKGKLEKMTWLVVCPDGEYVETDSYVKFIEQYA